MEEFISRLREKGLKRTPKREAIVSVLRNEAKALTPEQVYGRVKKRFGKASFPSVYRNLEVMFSLGIVHKVHKADRRLYYAICRGDKDVHHHHIVCLSCGRIEEFNICRFPHFKSYKGFKVTGHTLQVEGICPACLKNKN